MKKPILIISIVLALQSALSANSAPNLEQLLNSFIATYAKESRYLKEGVTSITDVSQIPPGAQLGYANSNLGYYYFFPKTWDKLSDPEKEMVMKDPRLKAFIISSRNSTTYPASTAGPSPQLKTPSFPTNGIAGTNYKSLERGSSEIVMHPSLAIEKIEQAYAIKEEKEAPVLELEIPAEELIKDIRFDVFIEKIN